MDRDKPEKPALLIIDMVKDYFDETAGFPITSLAKPIIGPINSLIGVFRTKNWPVVFSTDAFHEGDFVFSGRMKPHSLAGTEGAAVIGGLDRQPQDLWLPKPRFSTFWGTDLVQWLKAQEVTLCAVFGIATHFCVLTTALDAVCCDFKAVLLEDCSAAWFEEIPTQTLSLYRRNPLYPLFRVASPQDLVTEFRKTGK